MDERMRRIMCIDSPENGKTFAASDRLGRILLAGQVRPEAAEGVAVGVGTGKRVTGSSCVRRYARLAGHGSKLYCLVNDLSSSDSFWHGAPTSPPRATLCRPLEEVGCRHDVYYLN